MENWKTKVSTLWLMNGISIVSNILLALFETGDLTHIMPPIAVDAWSLSLISLAIIVVVAMAFLSQVLADSVSRWLNIVVGAAVGIAALVAAVSELAGGSVLAIVSFAGFVWMVLVVWIAWKSK